MSKRFIITEEEKNSILRTYLKLNEAPVKGKCISGNCVDGIGTYADKEWNTYVGEFADSKYEGKGVLTYKNGDIFDGTFESGDVWGDGTYTKKDGSTYNGEWIQSKNDKTDFLNGLSPNPGSRDFIVTYPTDSGSVYKYEGKLTSTGFGGKGVFTFPDETVYTGTFLQSNLGINNPITFDNDHNEDKTVDLIKFHNKTIPNSDVEGDDDDDDDDDDDVQQAVETDIKDTNGILKPDTTTTKENCISQLKNYANLIRGIQSGQVILKTPTEESLLRPTKKYIQNCWGTYPNAMERQKSDFLLVRNPGGDVSDYKIVLENANNRDIYNKNNMGLNGTISKIVTDYKLNKDRMIQEEKIIESRFNFVISEGVESIVSLIKEKNELINKGYTGKIIDRVYNRLIKNKF